MATHRFNTHDILEKKTVLALPNGQFLIPFVSGRSDDDCSVEFWGHYEISRFDFSNNITIIAATSVFNGGAVLVEKKDASVPETIRVDFDGKITKITF